MMRQEFLDKLRESWRWNRIRDKLEAVKPADPPKEIDIRARSFFQHGRAREPFLNGGAASIRDAAFRVGQRLRAWVGQSQAHPALVRLFARPGAIYGCVAVGASLLMVGLIVGAPRSGLPPSTSALKSQVPAEVPRAIATTVAPQVSRWQTVVPRLDEADRASMAALNARLAQLDTFFAECKKGIPFYTGEMLGNWGKMNAVGSALQQAASGLSQLFGQTREHQDPLGDMAHRELRKHVIDPAKLQTAIQSIAAGYRSDLAALEAKLLVDLRADLDDRSIGLGPEAIANWRIPDVSPLAEHVISQTVGDAGSDTLATAMRFGASYVVGNLIEGQLRGENDPALKRVGTMVASGVVADNLVGGAISMSGYDPARDMSAKLSAALDQMRNRIVISHANTNDNYAALCLIAITHPDLDVRDAAENAAAVMDRKAEIGLKARLTALHDANAYRRREAIYGHIHGTHARMPVTAVYAKDYTATRDELLAYVRKCIAAFGGTSR